LAYIGVQPADAYTSFAVQHFTTSATTSYTLDNPVANENEIALFINNVRQEPGSSYAYTASGTTLTLSAATSASDTMYCVFIGKAVQTVTPATGSVTNDMLAGSIANAKLANSSVTVNGTSIDLGASGTISAGITEADQWRMTANTTSGGGDYDITSNWSRVNSDGYGDIGTGMTESSGIFTFPNTGIWLIDFQVTSNLGSADAMETNIFTTTDNSTYSSASVTRVDSSIGGGETQGATCYCSFLFDVTSTSTHKCKFRIASQGTGSFVYGNNGTNFTSVLFTRLGDT